jgi:hypothetical protein
MGYCRSRSYCRSYCRTAARGGTDRLLARGDVLGGAEEGDYVGIAQSKSARFGEARHLFCEICDMAIHYASPQPVIPQL